MRSLTIHTTAAARAPKPSPGRLALLLAAAVTALLLAGCGDGGGQTTTAATQSPTAGATVNVSLGEWFVRPDQSTVSAGDVTFKATNDGTLDHELVVIKTDTPADKLPLDGGNVDEAKAGESPGEIAEFGPGATKKTTLTLTPGSYVFICNVPGHYQNGQYATFTAD